MRLGKNVMGRKRTPDEEKKVNIWVRLPNPVVWELEKEGKIKTVLERIIMDYYQNKTKYTKK